MLWAVSPSPETNIMRSRLMVLLAVVIAVAAGTFAVSHFVSFSAPGSLSAAPASYLGVYESGALGSYQPVADFTGVAGRQPNRSEERRVGKECRSRWSP